MMFEYSSNEYSAAKFQELEGVKTSQDESVFGKGWNLALLQQKYIFRLKAGCLYSKEQWKIIRDEFVAIVANLMGVPKKFIDCKCGGSCQ
ncbi:hypothetical protein [Filimonas effusa]|uniref:Uncharacterized protein n=1 Tax=Filimonas effusa TaxID=2508721 RepID=A0A4Q1DDI5_9BACT|nr:hypothetical protein [Filimonas effusa]RXK86629.1 hypothetical protein ESB13_07445 [Filimonas effusa]